MIEFIFGDPGACKTLMQSRIIEGLCEYNFALEKKYGIFRPVCFNKPIKLPERLARFIKPFEQLYELIFLRNADIVCEEIATQLPAERWKDTPLEVRAMLSEHRHRYLQIWSNTQDYKMVDINFRRMCKHVTYVKKWFGSDDPLDDRLPNNKRIWGMYAEYHIDRKLIEQDSNDLASAHFGLPHPHLIRRKYVEMTRLGDNVAKLIPPPLLHFERKCGTCDHVRVTHL